jgi:putative FmdB family regulatory protein
MPTYEYRCPNGHDFERFYRKISEAAADLACPVCGAEAHRRVSGGAGLLFKGSGFYLTDYGKNAHRRGGSGSASSESGGESKSSSAGESAKPDSGAAAKSEGGSSATKSDGSKGTESKASSKPTGGDAK